MNSPLRKSPKIKLVTLLPKYFQITQDNEMLVTDKSAKRANLLLARLSFQSRDYLLPSLGVQILKMMIG
ncbi:hypothetical protein AB8P52_01680 [Companilactobacillus pabuli]|uniref:hypothetical protein n=1 Tax=Companilactobacillus pabuli TaxID=2714036 RepID=UPI003515FFFF